MVIFCAKVDPNQAIYDEIDFRNLAIKFANESIENLRKELHEMED